MDIHHSNGQRQCPGQDRGRSGGLKGGGRDGVGFLEGKSGANLLTDFSLILLQLEKTMEKLKNGFENKPTNAMHPQSPAPSGVGVKVKLLNFLLLEDPH